MVTAVPAMILEDGSSKESKKGKLIMEFLKFINEKKHKELVEVVESNNSIKLLRFSK